MSDFRQLSDSVLASPQITLADVAEAKARGVGTIINNRPEGEADDQTPGADIEAAARAAGINYMAIPISPGGFNEDQVRAMTQALDAAEGKVLAYCRSGTRSTLLWALSQASNGARIDAVARAAADAGYDVSPIQSAMAALSAETRRQ